MGNQNAAIVFQLMQFVVKLVTEKYRYGQTTPDLLRRMALEVGNAIPPGKFVPEVEVYAEPECVGGVAVRFDWSRYHIGVEAAVTAYADEVWLRIMGR